MPADGWPGLGAGATAHRTEGGSAKDLQPTGKRALVTGGRRGIGKAVGRALASEGCDVALLVRDPQRLAAAAMSASLRSRRTSPTNSVLRASTSASSTPG